MTGRPPALDDVDDLDISPVPLGPILAAGLGIRRRRRRTLVVAAAVAAVVVGGGVFATGQFDNRNVARDPAAADGAVQPATTDLSVAVQPSETTELDPQTTEASARFEATSGTLIYESRRGYSSSCPPTGTATTTGQTVNLVLDSDTVNACTTDARVMTVTISGLTAPPTQLSVTENDELFTATVSTDDLQLPCDPADQRRTALDPAGPARKTPLEAVAAGANGNFVVDESGDSVVVHEVGPDGQVSRTYTVSRNDDGWLPDGWVECTGTPSTDPTNQASPSVPAVTASQTETPVASVGLQFIESDGVTVAVPESWVRDAGRCEFFGNATHLQAPGATADDMCGETPSVTITPIDSELGRTLTGKRVGTEVSTEIVGGLTIETRDSCSPAAACIFAYGTIVVVPTTGTVILVSAGGRNAQAVSESIINSLRAAPAG